MTAPAERVQHVSVPAMPVSPSGVPPAPARIFRYPGVRRARPAVTGRAGLFPWVPVCLALGIVIWFALPSEPAWGRWLLLAVIVAATLILSRVAVTLAGRGLIAWNVSDSLRLCGLAVTLIVAGIGLTGLRSAQVSAPILEWRYYGAIDGRVVHIDRSARDRIRLTLDSVMLEDVRPERTPDRVRVSLMDEAAKTLPVLGQRVMLTGHLGPPPGPAAPGAFDFRWHAWFARLGAVGYARKPVTMLGSPETGRWHLYRARMAISQQIQDRIGGQEGAVAAALMTGDRSGITEATNTIMRASNLYHIISISGLHMGMLAGFVYSAFRYAMVGLQAVRLSQALPAHKFAAVFAIFAAAVYLWLSGGGVATERAFIMVAVMLGAILADRRAISLRTVALAATIILIYSPESVTTPGFQMSFAATIALILSYGPWSVISPHLPVWLRPVAMLIVTSLIAGFATAPIAAAHFNQMAQYGLLANLLVVPVMGTLVMPAGVIGALLAPFGLAAPALWVMGVGTGWMLVVAEYIAGLGGSLAFIAAPPAPVLPLMGFGAVLLVLCWRRGILPATIGTMMMVGAAMLWLTAMRPMLLIAPEGEAAGLMTAEGRAMSKPTGGSFVVRTWLRQDGDTVTQAQSAERPGWSGDKRSRHAQLPGGWQVWHFTGKGSGEKAATACLPHRIVIASERTGLRTSQQQCLLFDLYALRRTGAVAVGFDGTGPVVRTVKDTGRMPGDTGAGR